MQAVGAVDVPVELLLLGDHLSVRSSRSRRARCPALRPTVPASLDAVSRLEQPGGSSSGLIERRARSRRQIRREREVLERGPIELVEPFPGRRASMPRTDPRRICPCCGMFCLSQKQAVEEFSTPSSPR